MAHILIEYLHDGLTWEIQFGNKKIPFSKINMGAFSERKQIFGKIWLGYSQKQSFRGAKLF